MVTQFARSYCSYGHRARAVTAAQTCETGRGLLGRLAAAGAPPVPVGNARQVP
jgi:hypothetical protein